MVNLVGGHHTVPHGQRAAAGVLVVFSPESLPIYGPQVRLLDVTENAPRCNHRYCLVLLSRNYGYNRRSVESYYIIQAMGVKYG
ncbi:hypothetical protein SeMB42_g05970 [Synchytrium endobioticum]|uniref:Uncharacterized protein n=1 Tax=Synchytrium endobioticum TaxID=286115 RepID=A0A507CG50_9FUNG|nr:hypothetical protein SeMB42_g05970 [Synchytrium endobioticum]